MRHTDADCTCGTADAARASASIPRNAHRETSRPIQHIRTRPRRRKPGHSVARYRRVQRDPRANSGRRGRGSGPSSIPPPLFQALPRRDNKSAPTPSLPRPWPNRIPHPVYDEWPDGNGPGSPCYSSRPLSRTAAASSVGAMTQVPVRDGGRRVAELGEIDRRVFPSCASVEARDDEAHAGIPAVYPGPSGETRQQPPNIRRIQPFFRISLYRGLMLTLTSRRADTPARRSSPGFVARAKIVIRYPLISGNFAVGRSVNVAQPSRRSSASRAGRYARRESPRGTRRRR